jgi:cyclin B
MELEENFEKPNESKNSIKGNTTKDSINSISTEGSSNISSISSLSNKNLSNLYNSNGGCNIFNIKFNNKEEYIKYNGEYINELYLNLLEEEKTLNTKPKYGYMAFQKEINEKMRAILIDWIIVVHDKFHLKSKSLYQTVWLIDTYLSRKFIKRSDLQLLGLGCLYIACKFQEVYYPQIKDFVEETDGAYNKDDLLRIEKDILKTNNYNLLPPSQDDFFNIISKYFGFNEKQYYLGKFFMENSLIDYNMIKFSPSVIAVSCSYIVMKFFGISNYKKLYSNRIILEKCPQKIIKDTAREICFLVKHLSTSEFKAVKEKYSSEKYFKVAEYCNDESS